MSVTWKDLWIISCQNTKRNSRSYNSRSGNIMCPAAENHASYHWWVCSTKPIAPHTHESDGLLPVWLGIGDTEMSRNPQWIDWNRTDRCASAVPLFLSFSQSDLDSSDKASIEDRRTKCSSPAASVVLDRGRQPVWTGHRPAHSTSPPRRSHRPRSLDSYTSMSPDRCPMLSAACASSSIAHWHRVADSGECLARSHPTDWTIVDADRTEGRCYRRSCSSLRAGALSYSGKRRDCCRENVAPPPPEWEKRRDRSRIRIAITELTNCSSANCDVDENDAEWVAAPDDCCTRVVSSCVGSSLSHIEKKTSANWISAKNETAACQSLIIVSYFDSGREMSVEIVDVAQHADAERRCRSRSTRSQCADRCFDRNRTTRGWCRMCIRQWLHAVRWDQTESWLWDFWDSGLCSNHHQHRSKLVSLPRHRRDIWLHLWGFSVSWWCEWHWTSRWCWSDDYGWDWTQDCCSKR